MSFPMDIRVASLFAILCFGGSTFALEQYMSGAIPIREPDNHYPILYSSVVPVIYKFHLPSWDLVTMKIQFWKKHNNCTESDRYEDGYPCPVLFHMNSLIENFTQNMTSWKNLLFDENSQKGSADFLQDSSMLWNERVCSNLGIDQHFKGMKASSSELDKYIQVLSQCAEANGTAFNVKFVNMTDVATNLENQYHDTFASFTSDYWPLLAGAQEAVAVVAWSAMESSLMVHQYMESQKWVDAVQTCSQQRIPWTLIDKTSLKELLTSLKKGYMEDTHDFAIPLEAISKYFKLPLSDCIFGDDNTFVVRIMIPLIPQEASSKNYFVKFHPVPFVTQGKVCSLFDGEESVAFNVGFNGIMPCSCSREETFCRAWNTEDRDACSTTQRHREMCLNAIASDVEQEIVEICPMKCRSTSQRSSPEQQQLHFTISNNGTDTVKIIPALLNEEINRATFVECVGKKMAIPLQTVGAYQMSIPSNCSIVNGESYVPTNQTIPTVERVKISHLMPYHWRKGITPETLPETDATSFLDNVERLDAVDPKINLLASKIQQLDQDSSRALSDTFLWLLVLLSLLMNIALVVVVLHLYKWKKEQVYKANRLVYNITPDDDIQHFQINGDHQTRPLCDADSL